LGLLVVALRIPARLGSRSGRGPHDALDSRPEVAWNKDVILMLLGSGFGAAIFLAIVAELSFLLRSNAQHIVARVVGSWITAIAILALSRRIVTQMTIG
jgi:hypothetical protein